MKRLTKPYKLANGTTAYAIVCENCPRYKDCLRRTDCTAELIKRIGELEDEEEKYENQT